MEHAGTDVIAILTADHRDMTALIGEIESAADEKRRRDLADTLIAEVVRHAVAEEMHVYPAIEDHVPGGSEAVQHDKREHEQIVRVMKQIEGADAAGPAFMALIRELGQLLLHHAHDEEDEQFPKLRAHVPAAKLVELGGKVEAAKRLAPTRPHPHAPQAELFHKTVGPGIGMIDRLRDKLTGRATGTP